MDATCWAGERRCTLGISRQCRAHLVPAPGQPNPILWSLKGWADQEWGGDGLCTVSWGLGCLLALAAKTKPNQVPEGATACATYGSKAALCHGGTSRLSLLSLLFLGKKLRHRAGRPGHQCLDFPAQSRWFLQMHRSQAAMVDRVPWECSRRVCWLQVSTKTSMLVTNQMLFTFPKCREVWGRRSARRGGEAHPPHLHYAVRTFFLCWGCGSREIQLDQKNY